MSDIDPERFERALLEAYDEIERLKDENKRLNRQIDQQVAMIDRLERRIDKGHD
jgi:multidrug resistance efflux pump